MQAMHRLGTAVVPATGFTRSELTALWNRAYEGYFVPVRFDEQLFGRHLRRAVVDLALSRVITVDGAAFGIADTHRRQGLARQLIQGQAQAWSQAGLHRVFLEVIAQNPARALYSQAGFAELRTLDVLEGSFQARGTVAATKLDHTDLAAVHTACAAISRPTWRRELPTVLDALDNEDAIALGVARGTAVVAYAIVPPAGNVLPDAAAIDESAAHDLLDALAAARPGIRWRLVDEPTGSPLFNAATARGAATVIRQIDMALNLHPPVDARPAP
jgi:GNAT superfamily N-acetyltransferase